MSGNAERVTQILADLGLSDHVPSDQLCNSRCLRFRRVGPIGSSGRSKNGNNEGKCEVTGERVVSNSNPCPVPDERNIQ